jgi:ssDNA-binding Zn-finger/Zn-ribbon topoisomerase 1
MFAPDFELAARFRCTEAFLILRRDLPRCEFFRRLAPLRVSRFSLPPELSEPEQSHKKNNNNKNVGTNERKKRSELFVMEIEPKNLKTDDRLALWEELCACGAGERHSPDTRMCNCSAVFDAGLDCKGCKAGSMLIKEGRGGRLFWGCSRFRKDGCKHTLPFGFPHDRAATQALERLRDERRKVTEEAERKAALIVDVHEREWLSECRCEGAENLDTFECYVRSEGGCGMLPVCPRCGRGYLFLKNGRNGRYWQCQMYRSGDCNFTESYRPHRSPVEPKKREYAAAAAAPTSSPSLSVVVNKKARTTTAASPRVMTKPPPKVTPAVASPLQVAPQGDVMVVDTMQTTTEESETKKPPATSKTSPTKPPPNVTPFAAPSPLQVAPQGDVVVVDTMEVPAFDYFEDDVFHSPEREPSPTPARKSQLPSPARLPLSPEKKTPPAAAKAAPHQLEVASQQGGVEEAVDAVETTTTKANETLPPPASLPHPSPEKNPTSTTTTPLSPEQKTMIEAKRLAAIERRKRFLTEKQKAELETKIQAAASRGTTHCLIPVNEPIRDAFVELADLYHNEGNHNAAVTYRKVANSLAVLDFAVTEENALGLGAGKTKVPAIGKATAEKIHELVTTGAMAKLEDKRKAAAARSKLI